ncbi:MAG: protease modulator HflK N-terminal domain-containing protein, partial [Rhodanobacteraceae bacterium]
MAWNEPGSGKQRDPWKDNGSGGGGGSPDFDAFLKRIGNFFNRVFGVGGGGGGFAIAAVGILIAWLLFDSWVAVKASNVGVVLRFGEFAREMAP